MVHISNGLWIADEDRHAAVLAAPAAALLDQPDVADHHRLVDRLDHVVDRQRRDGDRRQRLHLDAGAPVVRTRASIA